MSYLHKKQNQNLCSLESNQSGNTIMGTPLILCKMVYSQIYQIPKQSIYTVEITVIKPRPVSWFENVCFKMSTSFFRYLYLNITPMMSKPYQQQGWTPKF